MSENPGPASPGTPHGHDHDHDQQRQPVDTGPGPSAADVDPPSAGSAAEDPEEGSDAD
ncbi:hypothetical protein H9657_02550 [Cellulomonas sp. Sa3CUA2]|uniref:Uncharacterized protein n=1 Tax=Cellulomonas avistercoris TaxID=2762242 RepID=A0ABR8Q9Q6_9CELL|nr:hypothetical protein [Cellulomonas avistercoris]MBD7917158.1 hypothetical protein [Cellulomonas avistercoris]